MSDTGSGKTVRVKPRLSLKGRGLQILAQREHSRSELRRKLLVHARKPVAEGEVIDMGVEAKILEKSGSWFAYNGEKIGQGKDNAREFLRENPVLAVEIENKVREAMGIPLLPAADGAASEVATPAKKGRAAKEAAAAQE